MSKCVTVGRDGWCLSVGLCYSGVWWLVVECRNVLQGDVVVGGRVSECVTVGSDCWCLNVGLCNIGT